MKKIIPCLILLVLIFSACGSDYNMNGTYISTAGDMSFSLVILDDFCRLDVSKTNDNGETATAAFDGSVSKESDIAVIKIDKETGIDGNKFEFVYNRRKETLTATGDNSVFQKIKTKSILPTGTFAASLADVSYELSLDGDRCNLTVISSVDGGQTSVVYDKASVKVRGNVVTMEFEGNTLGDEGICRFIYGSDILMDTRDGKVFTKIMEE